MKKFPKGCLMTALVLFLVGLILSLVCGLLGGFRQLTEMGVNDFPFGLYRAFTGDWRIGPLRSQEYRMDELDDLEELEEIMDIEEVRKTVDNEMEKNLKNLAKKKEQLPLTADTLGSLEIDVSDCDVLILESEDEHVWFLVDGNANRPHYAIENERGRSELSIENEVEHHLGNWRKGPNDTVYLWLPTGCALEECEIDLGSGYMDSIFLKAGQIKVDLGAGLLEADGFEGKEVSLTVGAGELLADRIMAVKADFEIGAGHLDIRDLEVSGETDLEVSVGLAQIEGTILGNLDLDCEMGEVSVNLTGSEDDHSYEVECGMGEITVGSYSHAGIAAHKSWNSGTGSLFDISCDMGTVTVLFEK